jgi:hypothetical protein
MKSNTSRTAKHRMQKTWKESGAHLDKVATTKPVEQRRLRKAGARMGPGYVRGSPHLRYAVTKKRELRRQGNLGSSSARLHTVSMMQSGCRMGAPQ